MSVASTAAPLLRALLRLGREIDRRPELLSVLLGRPPRRFHPGLGREVTVPQSPWPFVDDAICEASGGSTEYAHPCGTAARAIRGHYRRVTALGLDYAGDARELLRRLEDSSRWSHALPGFPATFSASSREPLALRRLPPTEAGSSDSIRVGDLLVAHPLAVLFQPALDQAVIVVQSLEVVQDVPCVRGVALNKRDAAATLSGLLTEEDATGLEALRDVPLLRGGDVEWPGMPAREQVQLLHTLGPDRLPGARALGPGLWIGGRLEEAALLAAAGVAPLKSMSAVVGFAGWARKQLELELRRGVWVHARAEGDAAATLCLSRACGDEQWRRCLHALGMGCLALIPRIRESYGMLKDHVWRHEQEQLSEFARLAKRPSAE